MTTREEIAIERQIPTAHLITKSYRFDRIAILVARSFKAQVAASNNNSTRMKKINLAEPFEMLWTTISSLPLTHDPISQQTRETFKETNVKQLFREIYEAANGRQVATTIGLVAVAPPIARHLNDEPFFVETQADFFFQAMCRLAEHTRKRPRSLPSKPALDSTNGGDVVQLESTPIMY